MWTEKYRMHPTFLAHFNTEQEFVDAMYAMIIMFNYGTWLDTEKLCVKV